MKTAMDQPEVQPEDNPKDNAPTTWMGRNWWWLVPLAAGILVALLVGIVMAYQKINRRRTADAVSVLVTSLPPRTHQGRTPPPFVPPRPSRRSTGKSSQTNVAPKGGRVRTELTGVTLAPTPKSAKPTVRIGLPADDIDFTTTRSKGGRVRTGLTGVTLAPTPKSAKPTVRIGLPADDIDFTTTRSKGRPKMPLYKPLPLPQRRRRPTRLTTYIPSDTSSTSTSTMNPVTLM